MFRPSRGSDQSKIRLPKLSSAPGARELTALYEQARENRAPEVELVWQVPNTSKIYSTNIMVHPGEYILPRNKVERDQLKAAARGAKADFINIDELLQLTHEKHDYRPYFSESSHFSKHMRKFITQNLARHIASTISHSSQESAH